MSTNSNLWSNIFSFEYFIVLFLNFCLHSLNSYTVSYISPLDQASNCHFYSLLYNSYHWIMEESIKHFFSSFPCRNRTLLFLPQWHWEVWINIDKTSGLFEKPCYGSTESLTISHLLEPWKLKIYFPHKHTS